MSRRGATRISGKEPVLGTERESEDVVVTQGTRFLPPSRSPCRAQQLCGAREALVKSQGSHIARTPKAIPNPTKNLPFWTQLFA